MAIEVKNDDQLVLMRRAGLVVAEALAAVRAATRPGISTGELDQIAEDVIRSHGATPSFLGYHGFPASICASVNAEIVHGIPSSSRILADGDVLSVDCGAILAGWHGDSAITIGVGTIGADVERLIEVAQKSMWDGIAAGVCGAHLSDISAAIEGSVRASGAADGREYGIVSGYGGHGIGSAMHQDPYVLNYGKAGSGPRLTHGMALAIEPMLTLGDPDTAELDDGWTVVSVDGSLAVHVEHSYAITTSGPWVLTAPDGGKAELAARGVALSNLAAAE